MRDVAVAGEKFFVFQDVCEEHGRKIRFKDTFKISACNKRCVRLEHHVLARKENFIVLNESGVAELLAVAALKPVVGSGETITIEIRGENVMNSIVKLETRQVGENSIQTVNARELHSFLEVGKDFSSWMKAQIERARLVENRDFVTVTQKVGRKEGVRGASFSIEYHLTIDAGKHVGMISGTDKGFEIRDYFIECERQAKSQPLVPQTLPEALRLAADLAEQTTQLQQQLSVVIPKAAIADRIAIAEGLFGFRHTAKILALKEKMLRDWMVQHDWIYYLGKRMTGKYYAIKVGYIIERMKTIQIDGEEDKTIPEMYFTPKGIHRLAAIFNTAVDLSAGGES